ncbi:aromatic ring-hydroxylating dioxygenase subunit alpha [Streptomyces sp. Li-HN-5-11]|uniref:aromatic ring-hydroxylating oxygenase subunit alpha n=1 Tax=Streptomyces sp. Li-HN-5-11 TaxID=3075432 RepID=UPI0028ADDDF1|nr:aromatic ring-hydroxylating dioxygenase subunit alpha [Streptomyces sp. Li-HN-5-11]WNM34753.1 aromatic ring-hydroxylating dioxygenase subunit alpha [Streptomyces sp. Li-HN-5-11]
MIDLNGIADVRGGLVPPEIYSDPDLYQLELQNVFGRSWLFLAHDSQLPKPGSFLQTYMGEDPILVVRQRDGEVKAFLNQCRHRGMRICRTDAGAAKTFTCSYHGWAYDLAGNLINVPGEEAVYHGELDKSRWGAHKVPRIANHKGFYFGCWSDETPEFTDYLGDMAWYFDGLADRWDNGLELVPGTSKWVIDCNWKFAAEQAASDMYHAPISHASAQIALSAEAGAQAYLPYDAPGRQFTGNGHGTGGPWPPALVMPGTDKVYGPVYENWLADNQQELHRRIGETRALAALGHATIFPNFSWLGITATMRVYHPRGPEQMEVWTWTYMPKDAPEEVKESLRLGTQYTFSPAGVFETDDGENWTEVQRVLRGWKARTGSFNVQMGLGHEERDVHGVPGLTNQSVAETAARGFYQRWSDLVRGLSWQEIAERDAKRAAEEVKSA